MIIESRSIIFSSDELIMALRPVLESRGQNVNIVPDKMDLSLDGENEVSVVYHINGKADIHFNSREVGAAVLNHCIESGIPLPRGSYKELAVRGEHIALIVRLETGLAGGSIEDDGE